jgi:phenylacetate-CoA ligase
VLTREGALDAVTVEVELAPDLQADEAARVAKGGDLSHHIKSIIGVTCKIEIKSPGELPRSQGKAARVKDLRKKTN